MYESTTRGAGLCARIIGISLVAALWLPTPVLAAEGMASYYGKRFHGRRTASGQRFDQHALTAAHRSLRFGTRVRVTNLRNGKNVVVTINDRGPYAKGRILDLSRGAARRLGMVNAGVARVRLKVIGSGKAKSAVIETSDKAAQASVVQELF
ncbi:MAG: septal ring lytic transglycosylase RlpA family protein [Thiohalocapsa sp.]